MILPSLDSRYQVLRRVAFIGNISCETMDHLITVYKAKLYYERAEVVAVRNGYILETGTLESLQPWLSRHEYVIDNRFEDFIISIQA